MSVPVRPYAPVPVELPTGTESAEFDRQSIVDRGVPEVALMESAGRAAADVLSRLYPEGRVVACVGTGNNGGDALVLLRTLAARGREVAAVHVGERAADDPLLHGWTVPVFDETMLESAFAGAAVLVDGLLGTGIRGAPRERQAAVIRAMNGAGLPVVALDLPSGVDSDTGAVPGEAVQADVTIGFGWPKLGALLSPGRERAGRVVGVEIGFPPGAGFGQFALTPGWVADFRPTREPDTHKNAVGALLLVAGQPGMAGAAVLAGRAALRAGVGFLRIASDASNREVLQATLPEAVFVDAGDPDALADAVERSHGLAVGPGLGIGPEAASALDTVLAAQENRPMVLDADGINLIAGGAGLAPRTKRGPILVTPHLGEMSRLTGKDVESLAANRVASARALSAETGVCVLLKGFPSVLAYPGAPTLVDTVATSDLARAGMGDVLTGAIGSFLAQGVPIAIAGGLGLYHVGRAAVHAGLGSATSPEDVIESIPAALRETGPGDSDLDLPCVTFDHDAPR